MKRIILSDEDYDLFDEEFDSEYVESYMEMHLHQWEEMFYKQGRPFWLHFLVTYRSFTWKSGFATNFCESATFPICKNKLKRLIDEACIGIHKRFVERHFTDVKRLFDDILIVIRNAHLIPHLATEISSHDPFYHKHTKKAYRHLFGDLGNKLAVWNVAVFIPFYVKFAGAVYNILKKWIKIVDSEKNEDNLYWPIPTEWNNENFQPGFFEHHLFLYWGKKLFDVLNVNNVYEKFSREIYKQQCYLEDSQNFCTCKTECNSNDRTKDCLIDDNSKKVIKKSVICKYLKKRKHNNKTSATKELFCTEMMGVILQVQKLEATKERLRKKLDKKLKKETSSNESDNNWSMKLLEKAEKQFRKETVTYKKSKTYLEKKKERNDGNSELANELYCVNESEIDTKLQMDEIDKKEFNKTTVNENDNYADDIKSSEQEVLKPVEALSQQDEFTKDLEDIGDNLDTIEKSIKEKGGIDFEEFKLLLETGRLLMKDIKSEKCDKVEANSSYSIEKKLSKLHICAQCLKKEPAPKTYKKCSRCKSEKFELPRYYCSKRCQVEDWEEVHRDEHIRAQKS